MILPTDRKIEPLRQSNTGWSEMSDQGVMQVEVLSGRILAATFDFCMLSNYQSSKQSTIFASL